MKKCAIVSLIVCVGLWTGTVYAAEAVLNNPPGAFDTFKKVVDTLSPQYETVWNWAGGEWSQGVSASVFNFKSGGLPIASLRAGYATGETFYGAVGFDLPGITKRWVPATIKGIATVQPLDTLWSVVGRYARVGGFWGHTWNSRDRMAYGMTFGAAFTF